MTDPLCPDAPCGPTTAHPRAVTNAPGLPVIDYRVGDFASFRAALLAPLPGEHELTRDGQPVWRPGPGDLGLQVVEWSAYLLEALTFYTDRWGQELFFRTAVLPESVRRLARVLGYRPRPGIAATGLLAAELTGAEEVELPAGFAFQSKPGPGQAPQIFELTAKTKAAPPGVVPAELDAPKLLLDAGKKSVWVTGTASVKPGDHLLLVQRNWAGGAGQWQWLAVAAVEGGKDAAGRKTTRVDFTTAVTLTGNPLAADYQLLRSARTETPWPHSYGSDWILINPTSVQLAFTPDSFGDEFEALDGIANAVWVTNRPLPPQVIAANSVHLDGYARELHAGDLLLFDAGDKLAPELTRVTHLNTATWYANTTGSPAVNPGKDVPGMPILHTVAGFAPSVAGGWDGVSTQTALRHGWRPVGELLPAPGAVLAVTSAQLRPSGAATFPFPFSGPALVSGSDGLGAAGKLTAASVTAATLTELPDPPVPLRPPLTVWTAVLPVSRGETVANEVLGSGDARRERQEFVLKKSPLTYLPGRDPRTDREYTSTLRVRVDGVEWQEVGTLYGQPPGATVFVTSEDDAGRTTVRFGGRLPTGTNNVVASYRHGSGAAAPAAGALATILKPRAGLRAVHNPAAVGGGGDPEARDRVRRYAPRSVLTFGRAVSADDFEAIAAAAPGVDRARAYWTFDAASQRGTATVYVGDTAAAAASAKAALAAACDPNRLPEVKTAVPRPVRVVLSLRVDAAYAPEQVTAAVRAALLDEDVGPFGKPGDRIGRGVFDSELAATVLAVPGAAALTLTRLSNATDADSAPAFPFAAPSATCGGHRHAPGEGRFFTLAVEALTVQPEGADAS